jgi:hypothetical protein
MICRYEEETLAMYAQGDLVTREALRLEDHILRCDECRSTIDQLRDGLAIFKSLRHETVSAAAVARMRQSVLNEVSEIERSRDWEIRLDRWLHGGLRRKYALAGLAIAAVFSGAVWRALPVTPASESVREVASPPVQIVEPEQALVARKVAPASTGGVGTAPDVPLRGHPGRSPSPPEVVQVVEPEEPKQVVVKLLTDDPNIVIYWLVDQNGGGI